MAAVHNQRGRHAQSVRNSCTTARGLRAHLRRNIHNSAGLTAAEAKALKKKVATLEKENDRLKEKVAAFEKTITERDKKITNLNEQLEIERGNTFMKKKTEFASRRI